MQLNVLLNLMHGDDICITCTTENIARHKNFNFVFKHRNKLTTLYNERLWLKSTSGKEPFHEDHCWGSLYAIYDQ